MLFCLLYKGITTDTVKSGGCFSHGPTRWVEDEVGIFRFCNGPILLLVNGLRSDGRSQNEKAGI